MKWKQLIARPLSEAIYHGDLTVVGIAAAAAGAVSWRVLELPLALAVLTAATVAVAAFGLAQLIPPRLWGRGWIAVAAWGNSRSSGAPAAPRPVPVLPAPAPVAAVVSRSTEPRPLKPYEIPDWECPAYECGLMASAGTHRWDDRGPYQLLSVHTLECPAGHRWSNSTDGG
ncbi:hypothetical protein ACH4PU_30670 [Streptomyces sp. NPDC021100]|uniref:hypothetical protein n=1 Tax=Streptomyces sp. NPDC021100 TaxID=3365114 RepID=UPI0037B3D5AF